MEICNLIIITFIIVFITDLTDWTDTIKRILWKFAYGDLNNYKNFNENNSIILKFFFCSLCQTWWICLIFLLFSQKFTIPYIGLSALLAYLTPVCKDILLTLKDLLTNAINFINNIFIKNK